MCIEWERGKKGTNLNGGSKGRRSSNGNETGKAVGHGREEVESRVSVEAYAQEELGALITKECYGNALQFKVQRL